MSKTVRRKKERHLVVGILTIPHSISTPHGRSHIMKAYADGFEKQGIVVVPVPFDTTHHELYYSLINGLVIPGGETVFLMKDKYLLETVRRFIELSLRPREYFPIWGTCFGYELLMALIGKISTFETITDHQRRSIMWTEEGRLSHIYRWLGVKEATRFETSARTAQNHEFGISPLRFLENARLRRFFRMIAVAKNDKGEEYVAAIEAKRHPIYGVQWHPERQVNAGLFSSFFISEMRKNTHRTSLPIRSIKSVATAKKCIQYPEHKERWCYFF